MAISVWVKEHRRLCEFSIVAVLLLVSILVRLSDLKDWQEQPNRTFFQEKPILRTFDGYYYLSLARDLVENQYDAVNTRRMIPDSPERPSPPPLLSIITATIHKATNFSLDWIAVILPTFLGSLLVIPLYFLGRYYGGPLMGVTSALLGSFAPYYFNRSSLGRFDTDLLNITFTLSVTYFFLRFAVVKTKSRYVHFAAGIITWLLFLWWWDTTPATATTLSLCPLVIALVFFYRPPRQEGISFFGSLFLVIGAFILWNGTAPFQNIYHHITHYLGSISGKSSNLFPNIFMAMDEQEVFSFAELIDHTTNNSILFLLSLLGLILLFRRKARTGLFLLAPLIMSILAICYSKRFVIFMTPLTALGLGFLAYEIWNLNGKWEKFRPAAPVLLVLCLIPPLVGVLPESHWPVTHPLVISGMDQARRKTPEDAVIWSWWDQGYPLQYWARRSTVSDGGVYDKLAVYNAIPMATEDFRFSANFMQFYVQHGRKGIRTFRKATSAWGDYTQRMNLLKAVLAAGPEGAKEILGNKELKPQGKRKSLEAWLAFLFPADSRPIYLFLDARMVNTVYWWYWLGTWDFSEKEGRHVYYKSFTHVDMNNKRAINNQGLQVDLVNGYTRIGEKVAPVKDVFVRIDNKQTKKVTFHKEGINFEMLLPGKLGVLASPEVAESVFNKLYLRHVSNRKYFVPVSLMTPAYQLWEVHGDRFTSGPE